MEPSTDRLSDDIADQTERKKAMDITQAWKDYDERIDQARIDRETMISMALKIHDGAIMGARKMRDRALSQARGCPKDEDD